MDEVRSATESAGRPLEPGTRFRDFEILGLLGRGGMGVVYRARQLSLGRDVALKFLAPEHSSSPRFVERFEREARTLAQLNHPNVLHVYDFGRDGGNLFLALEYVEGPSLAGLIRDRSLDPRRFKAILDDVASGLQAIHDAGLVHRDIKPSNILIGRDGAARISDFGLAVEAESDARLTDSGVFVGSPAYASPEAVRREALDPRSDLYGLGVVIYEALAGRPPFSAPYHAELLMKHVREAPSLTSVPREWQPVVSRLLAKDPASRYPSASALAADLARVPEAPRPRLRGWMIAFAILAGTILAGFWLRETPAPTSAAVDLMALIDLERDLLIGGGRTEGGSLQADQSLQLMVPYEPPEEYDLSVTARRLGTGDSIQAVLVCEGRQVIVVVDGWGGRTGLSNLDGRWGMSNASTHTGRVVPDAEPHRYDFLVRRGAIAFKFDGRTILDWRGDAARLDLPYTSRLPHSRALGLAMNPGWSIDKVELNAVTGTGRKLEHPVIDLPPEFVEGGRPFRLPYVPPEQYSLHLLAEPAGPESPLEIGLVRNGKRILVIVEDSAKDRTRARIEGTPTASRPYPETEFATTTRHIVCLVYKEGVIVTLNGRRAAYASADTLSSTGSDSTTEVPFISSGGGWRLQELKFIPFFEPGTPAD